MSGTTWYARLAACLCFALIAACGDDNGGNPSADAGTDTTQNDGGNDATDDAGGIDTGDDAGIDTTPQPDAGDDTAGPDTSVDTGPDTFFDPDVIDRPDTEVPTGPIELFAIDPNRGPEAGETQLLIFGNGFTVTTEVLINGRRAQGIDFVDAETLIARTPANPAGTYDVKVVDGAEQAVLLNGFTYFADLSVDRVEPARGPERGGVPSTVFGAGFTDDARVSVGGRQAIDTRVVSGGRIDFIVPAGVAGVADVRVTGTNGTGSIDGGFEYFAEPRLDAVRPAAGAAVGGYDVTLLGAGFADDVEVYVGALVVTPTSVSDTEVVVTMPAGVPGPIDLAVSSPTTGGDTLADGFIYVADVTGPLGIDGVTPATGDAAGSDLVTLAGPSVDTATSVTFGGAAATIVEAWPGALLVSTPAGTAGAVDVAVDNGTDTASLADGFTYLASLVIDGVDPDTGDSVGGDTVTINGAGFTAASRVRFGPLAATTTFVSSTELSVVTPPGSVGPVDVTVTDGARSVTAADAYTFTRDVAVYDLLPTRGARAGNTRVILRGDGFVGDVRVFFDDIEAPVVTVVDPSTLEVRTPPHDPATIRVRVEVDGEPYTVPPPFVYYDPFSDAGGWWGGDIDGSVNVTVLDGANGEPIEEAFVTLHVRADESVFSGVTDTNGQVTISEIGVVGPQTISAVAAGYSAATINNVDAENVIILLTSTTPPTPGTPPEGEPPPQFVGMLSGLDKITDPGPDEILLGVIRTTVPNGPLGRNPPGTGFTSVEYTDGEEELPYVLPSRLGDLAVVALCGVYNEVTEEFTPLYMGVSRGHSPRETGVDIPLDLDCNIHLDQSLTFKFVNPPSFDGAGENVAWPWLDFGGEGGIDFLVQTRGTDTIITSDHWTSLDHPELEGVTYFIEGGTEQMPDGFPFSYTYVRDLTNLDDRIDLRPLLPAADLVYPVAPAYRVVERRFEWTMSTDVDADFYYTYIGTPTLLGLQILWEIWVPGDENGFNLPYFPPGTEGDPLDPTLPLQFYVLAIDAYSFDYDNFELNDFGFNNWKSYSAAGWNIQVPAE